MKSVEQQVKKLEQRVHDQIPVARFIVWTQIEQLAIAEKLRRAAAALVKSQRQHRCKGGPAGVGCTAVSDERLSDLEDLLKGMLSFHSPKGKIPKAVKKLLADARKVRR